MKPNSERFMEKKRGGSNNRRAKAKRFQRVNSWVEIEDEDAPFEK